MRTCLTALGFITLTACSAFAAPAVATWTPGDPGIKSIDAIAFASDGVLLISDGKASQVVAVQTADTHAIKSDGPHVSNVLHEIAARIGVGDKSVEIGGIAVNPASGRGFF